jgi:hypothetical protein
MFICHIRDAGRGGTSSIRSSIPNRNATLSLRTVLSQAKLFSEESVTRRFALRLSLSLNESIRCEFSEIEHTHPLCTRDQSRREGSCCRNETYDRCGRATGAGFLATQGEPSRIAHNVTARVAVEPITLGSSAGRAESRPCRPPAWTRRAVAKDAPRASRISRASRTGIDRRAPAIARRFDRPGPARPALAPRESPLGFDAESA